MCGRFEGVDETWEQLHELLGGFAQLPPEIASQFAGREMRPTNNYPVIRVAKDGGFEVVEARWWLVPYFFKGAVKEWKATTFNAKIEEVADKPTFKSAWKSKHCLVPVKSFWEWSGEHPTEPKKKNRYCITRGDNHPMVLAGIWDQANTKDGPITSFTIMTRASGDDMTPLHSREPVILDPDQWAPWLQCTSMPELVTPARQGLFRPVEEKRYA